MQSETGDEAQSGAAEALLRLQETATGAKEEGAVVRWQKSEKVEGLEVVHKHVSGPSLKVGFLEFLILDAAICVDGPRTR
jgi:hypothetical protein